MPRKLVSWSAIISLFYVGSMADTGPSDYKELDPARNLATPLFSNSTNSAEILALQNALAGVTFSTGVEPNGIFDDLTAKALLSFQQSSSSVPPSEYGFVSVYTMALFDSMLGISACPSVGLGRIAGDKVTTQISDGAVAVLDAYWDFPIGTEIPFYADNQTYVGRIELHYHPWGGSIHPYGYHHGVSVFYYDASILGLSGSEFLAFTDPMTIAQREDHILLQYAAKNMPSHLIDNWKQITAYSEDKSRSVTFSVKNDYLAIGNSNDFVRFPAMAFTAQKIADLYDASVPTTKMVDLIWAAASAKTQPQPIPPSDFMCNNTYVNNENNLVNAQLAALLPPNTDLATQLVDGDKKDTVLTNLYYNSSDGKSHIDSVAEYGWHQQDGSVIQPLYMGHSSDWADYSMGIRLVSNRVLVDTKTETTLQAVLADSELSSILSSEGPIALARIPINKRPAAACYSP